MICLDTSNGTDHISRFVSITVNPVQRVSKSRQVPAFLFICRRPGTNRQKIRLSTMVKQIRKLWVIILSVMACACTEKEPEIIHVSSILLNPTSISITEGQTATISATISPSNASNQKVIWSCSDASVATVNDGVVAAIKSGAATITAKADDKIATCDISVYPATGAITIDATHITCRSAELSGKVNFSQASTDMVFGILYSTSSGVLYGKSENLEAAVFDADYNFSLPTKVLEPETTYYYRSYLSQNGEILYGEVKSFTTSPVSSLIQTGDATDIYPKGATLSAILDLTDHCYNTMEYGFHVGYVYNGERHNLSSIVSNELYNKKYSYNFQYDIKEREYFYQAYVKLDENIYYGEEKTFVSPLVIADVTCEVDVSYLDATISGKLSIKTEGSFSTSAEISYKNSTDLPFTKWATENIDLKEDGSYSIKLKSLSSNTKYYFQIKFCIDNQEIVTDNKSFTTSAIVFSTTCEVMNISYEEAKIVCKVIKPEDVPIRDVEVKIYCSKRNNIVSEIKQGTIRGSSTYDSISNSYYCKYVDLRSSTCYYYLVDVCVGDQEVMSEGTFKTGKLELEMVDLGLSVKWANANIGASDKRYDGDRYAWGETETKSSYTWTNYEWCDGTKDVITKYWDENSVLEPEDDVAHVKLGDKWRLPTKNEITELVKNCKWSERTYYNEQGQPQHVYYLYSKRNGNYIILPDCCYWTSISGYSEKETAYYFMAYDGWRYYCSAQMVYFLHSSDRCDGFHVRAVSD